MPSNDSVAEQIATIDRIYGREFSKSTKKRITRFIFFDSTVGRFPSPFETD